MQISVTGRHVEVTPPLREYIETKLQRLDRFLTPLEAQVTLSVEKYRHRAELQLKSRTGTFFAEEETADMYASVDQAVERIENQARRKRDKRVKSGQGRRAQHAKHHVLDGISDSARTSRPRLIPSRKFAIKPMSIEEAMMQLGSSDEEFIVFRNAASDEVNVIYRRRDGNLGLIEPEY